MWAQHADGRAVVAWMLLQGVDPAVGSETRRKLIQRWEAGAQASFVKVDEVLVAHGFHVSELPDNAWLEGYCNGRRQEAA
jgi:hypothetical protein